MKKLVTLMLALAMIISAVGVLAEADGKITIWTWDPTFNIKAMQIAKEMYLKDHPDAVIDIQEKLSEDIETAVIAIPAPCRTSCSFRITPSRSSSPTIRKCTPI